MFNKQTSLVLRVCRADYTSHDGFLWPSEIGAKVSAPDWKENRECGHGLHGWLYGQGDYSCVSYWEDDDTKWMVLEVNDSEIVKLEGKCKFPHAIIRFIGNRSDAAAYLIAHEPRAQVSAVIGACIKVDNNGIVHVGAFGTAVAGDEGTATAGNYGTATAGIYGTAVAGNYGIATAGNDGIATAGEQGTATTGINGISTAGYHGMAIAGDYGTATAGNYGTAIVGVNGTATVGNYGIAMAGERGEIRIQWWSECACRYRTKVGYVGEDGIKPDTLYRLDSNNNFEEADK